MKTGCLWIEEPSEVDVSVDGEGVLGARKCGLGLDAMGDKIFLWAHVVVWVVFLAAIFMN